jgi:hypothetical protein
MSTVSTVFTVLAICGIIIILLFVIQQRRAMVELKAELKRGAELMRGAVLSALSLESLAEDLESQTKKLTRTLEERGRALAQLIENSPMVITDEIFETLRGATFAILDGDGHPVCCGVFVTPCGVALTAASACKYARPAGGSVQTVHASTHTGREFWLQIVSARVGTLDVAVLRVSAAAGSGGSVPLPPRDHLPLLPVPLSSARLLGMPVTLIHGSIAWSVITTPRHTARDNGYVSCSRDSLLHCIIPSFRGQAGGALIFHGSKLLGLHTESWQSREEGRHSQRSILLRYTDAARLDTPQIKEAVAAAIGAAAAPTGAAASALGARRRSRSNWALLEEDRDR